MEQQREGEDTANPSQLLESKSAGWQSPDPLLRVPLKEITFVGKDVLLRMLAAAK